MKLCFSTLGCCDRELEQILALAKAYNISALEIRGIGGILNNAEIPAFSQERCKDTSRLLEDCGISVAALGTSVSFHAPDKYEKVISEGKAAVSIAERLGIPSIRVFGDRLTEGSTERVISGLLTLSALSDRVTVLLEVHGDFNTAEALTPIVEGMKGIENFGLIWDIEHTHKPYGDRWEEFYSVFRSHIRHVHIKDYSDRLRNLCLTGDGDIPIKQIAKRMLDDGYEGYFSLEWEKKWHPELPDMEDALDSFIRTMVGVV